MAFNEVCNHQFKQFFMAVTLSCLLLDATSGTVGEEGTANEKSTTTQDPVSDIRHVLPQANLENNTVIDLKVNLGDIAYLPCRFPQLSTLHQKVSWIRRWDWHILTTGVFTYTSDNRFKVLHSDGSDDWTLQLKYVEPRDDGMYECQMYTGTGVLSKFVNLHVSKPRALILGPSELHVQEGDSITLVCVIQQSKPPFVFWYHGEKMVNYDDGRHRLKVMTHIENTRTDSRLAIVDAKIWDSGNYSCVPPNVEPSYVIVYVTEAVDGDTVAAVQRRKPTSSSPSITSEIHQKKNFVFCIVYFVYYIFILR